MLSPTAIRILAGVLFVVVAGILILRRKRKSA
ncbi:MAG: LPXTG cell wall anchor domain-containing protein [Acidobacteria bacterium]|jgi:LPXTG-motif cell wall-anchored protein|nr:LPXTG cell wall anchor domain-containing protein [Acidobacteriota bacterium]